LGARVRFCSFEGASDNVWHILVNYSPDLFPPLHPSFCILLLGLIKGLVSWFTTPNLFFFSFCGAKQKVYPNSPAEKAGLIEESDFVIATPEALLHDQVSPILPALFSLIFFFFRLNFLFLYSPLSQSWLKATLIRNLDFIFITLKLINAGR